MRLALLMLIGLLAACGRGEEIVVQDAWIREAPPGTRIQAGYLTLTNSADTEVVLERVTSKSFERIELHEMRMRDGQMQMRKLERLAVPAKESVRLEPGGLHLMLIKPTKPLPAGKKVTLELYFGARILSVKAEVRKKD